MLLTKIISGGQTGADQGALAAALSLRLQTGGWMPKGWLTETGPMPELQNVGLVEHSSNSYKGRTLTNIINSDATLWFGDPRSPGGKLTLRYAANARKPCYTFVWPKTSIALVDTFFIDWLYNNAVQTLNVAGNRESKNPGIHIAVRDYLMKNITHIRQE